MNTTNTNEKIILWEKENDIDGEILYICPFCEFIMLLLDGDVTDNEYNYCPRCGSLLIK